MIGVVVVFLSSIALVGRARAPGLTETWAQDFHLVSDDAEVNDAMEDVLQQTVAQWSFVEAQLLEPNVRITMPEIAAPLQHLCSSLEVLANFHFVSGKPDKAVSILERACPLMELLPPDLEQKDFGQVAGQLCFTILRELYYRHRFELDWLGKHATEQKHDDAAEQMERRIRQLRAPFDHLRHKARAFPEEEKLWRHPHPSIRIIDRNAREYIAADDPERSVMLEESLAILEQLQNRALDKPDGSEAEAEAMEAHFTALAYIRIMEALEESGCDALIEELRDIRATIGLDSLDEYLMRRGRPDTPGLVDDPESLLLSTYDLNRLILRTYILFAFSSEMPNAKGDMWIPWADLLRQELRITADLLWLLEGGFATKLFKVDLEIASASVLMNPVTFDGLAQNLGLGITFDGLAHKRLDVDGDLPLLDHRHRQPRDEFSGGGFDLEDDWPDLSGEFGYFPRGRLSIACILFGILVTAACVVQALFFPERTQLSSVLSGHHERLKIKGKRPKPKARPRLRLRDRNKSKAVPVTGASTSPLASRGWESDDDDSEPDSDTDLSVLNPKPKIVQEGRQRSRAEQKQIANRNSRSRHVEPEAEHQRREIAISVQKERANEATGSHLEAHAQDDSRRSSRHKTKTEPEVTPEDTLSDYIDYGAHASPATPDTASIQRCTTSSGEALPSPKLSPDMAPTATSSSRRRTRRGKKAFRSTSTAIAPGEASSVLNASASQQCHTHRSGKNASKAWKTPGTDKHAHSENPNSKGGGHQRRGRSPSISSVDASPSLIPGETSALDVGSNHGFHGQLPPSQHANATASYIVDYQLLRQEGRAPEQRRRAPNNWPPGDPRLQQAKAHNQDRRKQNASSDSTVEEDEAAALFADLDRGLDLLKLDNEPQAESTSEPSSAPTPSLGGVHWTPLLDLGSNWES